MTEQIRVRILITTPDPISPRLWGVVRQDLASQLRDYFQHRPELLLERDGVTTIHTSVSEGVARVGLNAPAFALAVVNMLRLYQLPQRFQVRLAILGLSSPAFNRDSQRILSQSLDLVPVADGLREIETADLEVAAAYPGVEAA